jgi:hypothetical protein
VETARHVQDNRFNGLHTLGKTKLIKEFGG